MAIITINADTADKLKTPRLINGVPFDGSADIAIPTSGGSAAVDVAEERRHAIGVTLLRPSKLKWKIGNFGAFTTPERIYAKIVNLVRIGPATNIYSVQMAGGLMDSTPFSPGSVITSHVPTSVLCYVNHSDVAAVQNAKRTFNKMVDYLLCEGQHNNYQISAPNGGVTSAPQPVTVGTHGSIVTEFEGQHYSMALQTDIAGVEYNAFVGYFGDTNTPRENLHFGMARIPAWMPIAANMDGKTFSWKLRTSSASANYSAYLNARVVDLPPWWETDAT